MRRNQSKGRHTFLTALVVLALAASAWAAPKYKILHAFGLGNDGGGVWAGLVLDGKDNLYGTTSGGGGTGCNGSGCGTVFELTPQSHGKWKEVILHRFDGQDGEMPQAGMVFDAAGNLYGMTTTYGPSGNFGSVFELIPGSRGWSLTVLHDRGAWATLLLDQAGNPYGPMRSIGEYGQGAISELVKDDGWTENWLYSFCAKHNRHNYCIGGDDAYAGVTWGPDGSLYGTTVEGGNGGYGVVFQLTPQQDGAWKETVLHSFPAFNGDGQKPYEGVVLDGAGNVYGATYQGGGGGLDCGVIFKLAPQGNGKWKETILYDFPKLSQGCIANTLAFDAKGNLWSTAQSGGTSGNGVVFELTPQPSGKWKYQVVHQFNWNDGSLPGAAVIFDNQGNLYGTTILGGAPSYGGVAFEITP